MKRNRSVKHISGQRSLYIYIHMYVSHIETICIIISYQFKYLHTYLHTTTYINTYIHSYIRTHVHTCIEKCIYIHIHVDAYMCRYLYVHPCMKLASHVQLFLACSARKIATVVETSGKFHSTARRPRKTGCRNSSKSAVGLWHFQVLWDDT